MIANDPDCSNCPRLFPDDDDDDFWDVMKINIIIIIDEEDNDPDCSRCPRPFPEHRSRPNGRSGCEGRCASLVRKQIRWMFKVFPFRENKLDLDVQSVDEMKPS